MARRIAAIVLIYLVISAGWLVLGAVMTSRTHSLGRQLSSEVAGLWGAAQVQQAPDIQFNWWTSEWVSQEVTDPNTKKAQIVRKMEKALQQAPVVLDSSNVMTDFALDYRQKGLLWFSTYLVRFKGEYSYTHQDEKSGVVRILFRFPTPQATYDDFQFTVNGDSSPQAAPASSEAGSAIAHEIPVQTGQRVDFAISYTSRGLDHWQYSFGPDVNRVKNFRLTMNTDFNAIDFPDGTISPSQKEKTGEGWELTWAFNDLISGLGIGMEMPKKLNPGPLAAQISLFAPVCLLFFFVWMFVISLLKKVDLHPMNYLFLGAAFFSFHLLFNYTVDHIPLLAAFVASSAVSIFLVITYLRLAVGIRFAAVEAGISQFIYLVLFSYAHFYQGWTGLIVTIGSILTLFVIMQLTGRINWTEKFAQPGTPPIGPQTPIG